MKLRFIDFEYNSTSESRLNLVSYAQRLMDTKTRQFKDQTVWLHLEDDLKVPPDPKSAVLVAFNVVAEASALLSWGADPLEYQWIDLQAEYRMLTNHWDEYRYGRQLIDGKEISTLNPRMKDRKPYGRFDRPRTSLASACYKMLGVKLDTDHKDEIRSLIIRNDPDEIESNRREITDYNLSDIVYMPDLLSAIIKAFKRRSRFSQREMLERGRSVAHTAVMAMRGYPVNRKDLVNFSEAVPNILKDIQGHINEQFPDMGVFQWDKKNGRYSMRQAPIKEWIIKESGKSRFWPKTEHGSYSLSFIDAWSSLYSFRSPYPEGNFPAQMYRYLRLKQSLNGFIPKGVSSRDRSNFFTYVGRDSRARPYLNPYGAQSSRFQPKATGYLPLKPSWMRCFIEPGPGNAILGVDYKSQEFLIAALLSEDKNMLESYVSGDPYFDFAKKAKAVPRDATKEEYPHVRAKFKSTVLGIQYLMGANSLAQKITADTGEVCSKEDAEFLISMFQRVYSRYDKYRERKLRDYRRDKYLKLSDGWTLFGDNCNHRSVANFPVQGEGAVVLRKAIELAHAAELKPILPLHDALYIEIKERSLAQVDTFCSVMKEAFISVFNTPEAENIKIDVYAFSPRYKTEDKKTPGGNVVHRMPKYLEGRGLDEYNRFSKYFRR